MSKDLEMLSVIYQNAEMGKDTITHLIEITDSVDFRKRLEAQLIEYQGIFDRADQAIQQQKKTVEGIGPFAKISSYMMINFKTLADKSPSHIAEMMIQGSTMGIVDMTKKLNETEGFHGTARHLAEEYIQSEQNHIESMKQYL